jgi:hypothetical protein
MTAREVCASRMAAQFLTTKGPRRASDVVRALGAVQAQDYAGAKWALSQRARDASNADIEQEYAAGAILRTHVLRPTWHFVAPEDIRWMLELTAPRVSAAMASYNRKLELDVAVFRRSHAVIRKALAGGKSLTRAELKAALERAGIIVGPVQRLGHLMMQAELDAVICSGPMRGKQFTYMLLDERAAPASAFDRDQALNELTRRYFAARGPATAHDFAWWSGLSMADVKRGIEITLGDLEAITVRDRPHWRMADAPEVSAGRSEHLLPNYDEYFIGLKDRGAIGERAGSDEQAKGGDALVNHLAFIDGQLVGGWRRTIDKRAVIVRLNLITRISRAEKARLTAQANRYASFVGLPLRLEETQ